MRKIFLDYDELRSAAKGRHKEIANAMNRTTVSVWAKMSKRTKFTLDDLNTICNVVKRDPSDFIHFKD